MRESNKYSVDRRILIVYKHLLGRFFQLIMKFYYFGTVTHFDNFTCLTSYFMLVREDYYKNWTLLYT